MRTLVGFGLSLLLAAGLFAQYRGGFGNSRPLAQGASGNAVFPGGRPQLIVPGAVADPTFAMRLGATVAPPGLWRRPSVPGTRRPGMVFVYGYPVYVGGYFDNASVQHGWLLKDGVATNIDFPDHNEVGTVAWDVNDSGLISGYWKDTAQNFRGFFRDMKSGKFTEITVPGANYVRLLGMNKAGFIAVDSNNGEFIYCPKSKSKCP